MVDRIKAMRFGEIVVAITSTVSAIGIIGGFVLWLSGAFAGATIAASKLSALEGQVTALISQVQRLQDQLNSGVRVDQVIALDHHIAAVEGHVQAADDRADVRLRELESRVSKIEGASGVTLNRR